MELKEVIKSLILEFRNQLSKLTQKEKEGSGFVKFEPPLQVELIRVERKKHKIDFQILVFSKFTELDDLEIIIHDPLKFKNRKEYIQKLDEIAHSDKWLNTTFPNRIKASKNDPDELSYSKRYENVISEAKNYFFTFFTNYLLTDQYVLPHIFIGQTDYSRLFYWIIFGNLQELNVNEYVKDRVIGYKKSAEKRLEKELLIESPEIQKQFKEQDDYTVHGYGTFIVPPKWIGEYPQLTIEDKLTNQRLGSFVKEPILTTYKGRELLIEKDGYIAIGENYEETAIQLLNEIMGIMNFLDEGAYAIRTSEVGNATINTKLEMISSKGTPNMCKHRILENERSRIYRSFPKILRNHISAEKMKQIIKTAEKITRDKEIKTYLILYSESLGYFEEKEYTLSFLMSWIIFEKILTSNFIELKNQNNLDVLIKDYINNNWQIPDVMIKALLMGNQINQDEFNFYMEFKNQRNCIIHENSKGTWEESYKIKNYCYEQINTLIQKLL